VCVRARTQLQGAYDEGAEDGISQTDRLRESLKEEGDGVNTGEADWRLLIARTPAGRERERERESVCVCVCVREREREAGRDDADRDGHSWLQRHGWDL